jgi:sugar lactone lactonase YvrE
MLFRKHIVSTRTLLQLTVAVLFLVAAVGAAVAANTGNTPVLVPYTIYTVAGTPQWSFAATPAIVGGFGSMPSTAADGGFGVPYINSAGTLVPGATLNSPWGFAVDSVGDIYIADKSNDLIREVNYSTGLINIVAGITPTGCKSVTTGTVNSYSCTANLGCGDGVLASLAKVGGGIDGVAVDAYGNVYFADSTSSTVSVVYRGGTQVANFIKLVNPAAVANSPNGQVTVGYVYHIAGEINLGSPLNTGATCAGSKSNNSYIIDNAPAFENTAIPGAIVGATLSGPTQITLDSAGNIYISDVGNTTVRVINTQATPQTFFQYTVQPGYMQSITNCGVMTASTPCAATKTAAVGTGINGPSNALLFSSQYVYAGADAYGNVYQLNGTGGSIAVPGYYESVSYAGGVPLTNLLTAEVPTLSSVYSATETAYPVPSSDTKTPNELPLTYGNAYIVISNPSLNSALPSGFLNVIVTTTNQFAIRPVSVKPDSFGNLYYYDNHFQEISRIDQYTADGLLLSSGWAGHPRSQSSVTGLNTVTNLNADGTVSNSSNYNQPASMTTSTTLASPTPNPWDCIYGASGHPWTWGPQTYDPVGDGCPGMIAAVSSSTGTSNGDYFTDNDGLGNLYFGDNYNNLIREMPLGTQFPATPVVPSTAGAWSTTATYALNNVVNYTLPCPPSPATCTATPHAYYISLKAANTGNIPNMSPTYWRMVSETQPIQVHFDVSNIPFTGGGTQASTGFASTSIPDGPSLGYTTNAFTITGSGDFSIDTTDPEYPLGSLWQTSGVYGYTPQTTNFAMYPVYGSTGYPTCTQLGVSSPDNSWDCLVYVTFNPTQPGLRTGQLVATTANGSVYNFQLTGTGTGGQLAIDGGAQQVLATSAGNGLGTLASIAMTSGGTGYIADPTNNRIVVETPSGTSPNQTTIQTAIGPSITVSNTLFGQTTTTKSTLSGPMGVAVDAAGNVYIADTGNSRILEYNPVTGTATQLGNYLWIPGATCDGGTTPAAADCNYTAYTLAGGGFSSSILNEPGASVTPTTAPPQYKFKNPQGLAVDQWGNVYVADTGNSVIVEIPSDTKLGGATQLFQYPGAPTFTTPVAVAIGPMIGPKGENWPGYIFVADTGNPAGEIVRIPPGGGDLQPTTTTTAGTSAMSVLTALPLFGGSLINTPNGVAVDAAGNVYVSDSTGNAVWEAPAVSTSAPFKLNFTGLKAPAGLALDANGNLYVADSGNQQILEMNRQNPVVSFGTVPEGLTAAAQPICANTIISNGLNIGNLTAGVAGTPSDGSCVLTVTNLGNQPVALASTFLGATGNGAYTVSSKGCGSSILVGTTCTISPKFTPATTVSNAATVSVNTVNGTQTMSLQAQGANPEVLITLSPSNGTVISGTTTNYSTAVGAEAITATVAPFVTGGPAPTGTVTFSWTIAPTVGGISCGSPGSQTVNLVAGVATTTTFPALTAGLWYTVNVTYNGDGNNSATSATPIVLKTAPVATVVTVTSTLLQLTYTYGGTVPTPACTVTAGGTAVAGVTCTSGAGQYTATGSYPIQVVFTGSSACSYGFPTVTTGQANVIENRAALTVTIPAYTTVYGAATFNYASGMVITGAVGADLKKLSATFSVVVGGTINTPADSSVLDVVPGSPYTVTPIMTGKPIGNYTVTINPGTDTITPAPAGIAITAAKTSVANTTAGLASASYTIALSSLVTAGKGVPTGTVSVYDYFVPITSTIFVPTPTSGTFQVVNGAITWPTTAAYGVQTVLIPPCATGQTSTAAIPCNTVVTFTAASAGAGTFTLPATEATTTGTHYLSFVYSGDAGSNGDGKGDFACSVAGQLATTSPSCPTTNPIPFALIVDNPDFTLTSTTGPISVVPGTVPSGNGLPSAPNQSSANPQSAILSIGGVLGFTGTVNLSNCVTQHPSYVSCFVGQLIVVNGATQPVPYATVVNGATVAVVFDVSTPATLPLGFNTTAQLRTTATRTVLAFLPFGVLAFCVRRRRRLSKALWMLIAIAAVSVGMSGCGGNSVDFYTPIPTGPQTVTVNASYTYVSSVPTQPSVTRSFVVPITIN